MSAETALRAALVADATVAGLVSDRVRAERAEEDDARPFVVYTRVSSEPFAALAGPVLATRVTLEVQCWADTRAGAEALADAVTAAVRAIPPHRVSNRGSGFDADLDVEAAILTVEWWEQ